MKGNLNIGQIFIVGFESEINPHLNPGMKFVSLDQNPDQIPDHFFYIEHDIISKNGKKLNQNYQNYRSIT